MPDLPIKAKKKRMQTDTCVPSTSLKIGSVVVPRNYRRTRLNKSDDALINALAGFSTSLRFIQEKYGLTRTELTILAACDMIARNGEGIFIRPQLLEWFHGIFDHKNIYASVAQLRTVGLVEAITQSKTRYITHKYQVTVLGIRVLRDYIKTIRTLFEDKKQSEIIY